MRPSVTSFDSNGNITAIHYGPTNEELEVVHNENNCLWGCPFCYQMACDFLQKPLQSSNN